MNYGSSAKKLAVVVFTSLMVLVACSSSAGKPFVSQDGNFSVVFPGEPKVDSQVSPTAAGDIKVNIVSYDIDKKNGSAVMYVDFPDAVIKAGDPKTLLENGLQGQLAGGLGTDMKVEVKKDADFNGNTGLYARAKSSTGYAVTKDFLIGNRAYILMIVNEKAYPTDAEEKAFLDSFKLLK